MAKFGYYVAITRLNGEIANGFMISDPENHYMFLRNFTNLKIEEFWDHNSSRLPRINEIFFRRKSFFNLVLLWELSSLWRQLGFFEYIFLLKENENFSYFFLLRIRQLGIN